MQTHKIKRKHKTYRASYGMHVLHFVRKIHPARLRTW